MTEKWQEELDKKFVKFYMGLVGLVLTGREVKVQFREPYLKKTRGMAFRSGNGAIVQVKPGMSEEQTLKTYLHELGHVKHHFQYLPADGSHRKPAGSHVWTNKKGYDEKYGEREEKAREFSDKWFDYAVRHGEGSLRSRLLVLVGLAFKV